jgi:hypothetical protein
LVGSSINDIDFSLKARFFSGTSEKSSHKVFFFMVLTNITRPHYALRQFRQTNSADQCRLMAGRAPDVPERQQIKIHSTS